MDMEEMKVTRFPKDFLWGSASADKVVAITDCLVPFPNFPAHISMTRVDYVVEVDAIGDPKKIATGAAKPTTDQRKLMMADYCTKFVVNSPYFKDGFSYQTGVGGTYSTLIAGRNRNHVCYDYTSRV